MLNWGMQNATKVHKVKAKKNLTIMLITDPTKHGLTLRVPKWTRFIMLVILLGLFAGVYMTVNHIVDLEQQLAYERAQASNSNLELLTTNLAVEDLVEENDNKYDQLEQLAVLTVKLKDKLAELETYKASLDERLGTAEKSTDSVPDRALDVTSEDISQEIHLSVETSMSAERDLKGSIGEDDALITGDFDADVDALLTELDQALGQADVENVELTVRETQMDEILPYWDSYPSVLPVANTYVTSPYGYRRNPFGSGYEFHSGVDLKAHYTEVYATGAGVVTYAGYNSGYGYLVIIDHGYGLTTKYGHNSKILVEVGDEVSRYDVIAISGNSGRSSGPHVHYEVLLNNETQNPLDYLYTDSE